MKKSSGMCLILINTVVLLLVEIAAHHQSNAMSVLGEAFHMLADLFTVALNVTSSLVARKFTGTPQYTFGVERLEVLTSCVSLALLWIPSFCLFWASLMRISSPEKVDKSVLFAASLFSIGINLANVAISMYMNKNSDDMAVTSIYVHALSDLAQSLGMCISALALHIDPGYVGVDLACTILSCIVCVAGSRRLAKEVWRMLMDISPVDIEEAKRTLMQVSQVESVDDLKIWATNRRKVLGMAKVTVRKGESQEEAKRSCKYILEKNFSITYTNIEVNAL